MAAGLTVKEESVEELRERLNAACTLPPEAFVPRVTIDAAMPLRYVNEKLIRQLEDLAPFGKGNPEPLFAQKNIRAEYPKLIGQKKNVLKMRLSSADGTVMDGILFRGAEEAYERILRNPEIMIAYVPRINVYNGFRNLQAEIRNIQ